MRSGIKVKFGSCICCPENAPEKPLIDGFHCQHHYWIYRAEVAEEKKKKRAEMNAFLGVPPKEPKKPKPIAKVSEKQIERLAKYRKVRDQFMKEHPNCQARLQGCTIKATDCHHSRGKVGDLLTDKRYFKALCRSCHNYIETHPSQSKEMGFSLSRLENIENITKI